MLSIRNMNERDIETLQDMIANMIGGPDIHAVAKQEIEKYSSQKDFKVYIAETDGLVVGFGVVKYNPFEGSDGIAELGLFQIKEEFRKRGFGTELFNHIESNLRAEGMRKLYTKTNPKNLKAVCYWLAKAFEFEARLIEVNIGTDYYLLSKPIMAKE